MSKKAGKNLAGKKSSKPLNSNQLKETVISQPTGNSYHSGPGLVVDRPKKAARRPAAKPPQLPKSPKKIGGSTLITSKSAAVQSQISEKALSQELISAKTQTSWISQPINRFKIAFIGILVLGGVAAGTMSDLAVDSYRKTVSSMEGWFDWNNWAKEIGQQKNEAPYGDEMPGTLMPEKSEFGHAPTDIPEAVETPETVLNNNPAPLPGDELNADRGPMGAEIQDAKPAEAKKDIIQQTPVKAVVAPKKVVKKPAASKASGKKKAVAKTKAKGKAKAKPKSKAKK